MATATDARTKRERQDRARNASSGSGGARSDYETSKRAARENERAQRETIEAQMRAEGKDPATGQSVNNQRGAAAPTQQQYRPAFVPQAVHNFTTGSPGGTVAGAILGALAFFTGRAFIQGGWSGVRAFYAAKFLNRTSTAPNPVPVSATTTPTLPVNTASGGAAAPSSPTTSSGSAQGGGQTPAGAGAVGSRIRGAIQ